MSDLDIAIAVYALTMLVYTVEELYGWEAVFRAFRPAKTQVVNMVEPLPSNTIYHLLPDGRIAKVVNEMGVGEYEIPELNKTITMNRYEYEYEGNIFSKNWAADQLKPTNPQARLGLDGALWVVVRKPEDKKELERRVLALSRKVGVRDIELKRESEDSEAKIKKFADNAEYVKKKIGPSGYPYGGKDKRRMGDMEELGIPPFEGGGGEM